jgi:hypothetical protein
MRIAREYLLFLSHYGYIIREATNYRINERYFYNTALDTEIAAILAEQHVDETLQQTIERIRIDDITADIEKENALKYNGQIDRIKLAFVKMYSQCMDVVLLPM